MAKVYLETSFFSLCVSRRTGPKELGRKATSNEWWQTQSGRHELFVSPEVVRELSAPEFPNSADALEMLRGLGLLELSVEIGDLARLLIEERVMPGPATEGDAIHVATAAIYGMDYILTWNVKHLANPNKRTHFSIICMRLGLTPPLVMTPDLLQEDNDE